MFVGVTLLEDCARNLRMAYELPAPVDEAFFAATGADGVVVNRFAERVAGASNHLVATWLDPPVRAEAVDGSTRVTVTYGSLHGRARPEAVATIEARLLAAMSSGPEPPT